MIDPEPILKARLRWVKHYEQSQNAALTCRRCGICKATLLKWWRRYQSEGEAGLHSQSRRPHKLRERKVTPEHESLVLDMRRRRHLGPKGLQRELLRLHQLRFSTRTIWKILHSHGVSVLKASKRRRGFKRYTRPVPGDRVQIDTCKVGKHLYQFTAIDDCTRMRVLALYSSRSAIHAAHFVEHCLLPQFPFPVQRIQSDRGGEFIGVEFQDVLRDNHIKFRPNRPRAPHLNGKVERSQRTDRMEFWSTVDNTAPRESLDEQVAQWQNFYNQERTHSAIHCKTPNARFQELIEILPTHEAVHAAYVPTLKKYVTNNHYYWAMPDRI